MSNQPTDPQQVQELMQQLADILIEAGHKPATPVGAPKPRPGGKRNGFWIEFCPEGPSPEDNPRPEGYRAEFHVYEIHNGTVDNFSSRSKIKRFKQALKKSGWYCVHSLDNPLRTFPMPMHEEQHRLSREIREKELRPIRNEKKRSQSAERRLWSQNLDAKRAAELKEKIEAVGIMEEVPAGPFRSKKAGELLSVWLILNDGAEEMVWDIVPSDGSAKERFYDRDKAVKAHIALGKKPNPKM